jgi:hypothetical protein
VAQPYEFHITMTIWHPSIVPAAISRRLRMRPHRTQTVGTPRRTPKGQRLDGTYPRSYWSADVTPGGVSSVRKPPEWYVARVGRRLEPHGVFLRRLRREGGRVLLWVSTHGEKNYAVELSPAALELLAGAGVELALDVYPNRQNW